MSTRIQNIIILQKSKSLPLQLRETLRQQGYSSTTVFDVETALASLRETHHTLLLVDCGENRQLAALTIKQLVNTPDICDYPSLIITADPPAFQEAFDRYFMLIKAIDSPCGITTIMEAIREIDTLLPEYLKRLAKVAPEKLFHQSPSMAFSQSALAEQQAEAHTHTPLTETKLQQKQVPLWIDTPLPRRDMNGQLYVSSLSEEQLIKLGSFPEDAHVAAEARAICAVLPERERSHLYRTAFIYGQTVVALELPNDLRHHCVGAAFLFAKAFFPHRLDLLKINYLSSRHTHLRQKIAETIRESASVSEELGWPEISTIVHGFALLIDQAQDPSDDKHILAASGLMAADLMDRICFHSGYWDPRASYVFLHKTGKENIIGLHPKILPYLIKLLIESISAKKPAFLVPKKLRRDPALLAAAAELHQRKVRSTERKVEISHLRPGMRLTRPLQGFDGSVVLPADIILDADLIWRLWKLASIKVINTPLFIEETKASSHSDSRINPSRPKIPTLGYPHFKAI